MRILLYKYLVPFTSQERANRTPQKVRNNNKTKIMASHDRPMNDTTMPPPKILPAKDGATAAATTTTTTTTTTLRNNNDNNTATTTIRKPAVNPRARAKGGLRPGFGLYDWKLLLSKSNDLAQRKGAPIRRDIPIEEVRRHNQVHDGWIILKQRVYNIGPYLHYHPGGVNIFKPVLGKDATTLFDKYHPWVNIDGLVGPLLLGTIEPPKREEERMDYAHHILPVSPKESALPLAPRILPKQVERGSLLDFPRPGDDDDNEEEEEDEDE